MIAKAGINVVRITTIDNWVLNDVTIPDINYETNPALEGLGVQQVFPLLLLATIAAINPYLFPNISAIVDIANIGELRQFSRIEIYH
jgi:hypothetical protein